MNFFQSLELSSAPFWQGWLCPDLPLVYCLFCSYFPLWLAVHLTALKCLAGRGEQQCLPLSVRVARGFDGSAKPGSAKLDFSSIF